MYYIDSKKDKPNSKEFLDYMQGVAKRGFRISTTAEAKLSKLKCAAQALKTEISKFGISNPNSSKQVTEYLEYSAGKIAGKGRNIIAEVCYDPDTGKWTSKAEALEVLADNGIEFAKTMLEYRDAKKRAESVESLLNCMDADRLVHPTVTMTVTHRITFSKPAIMSIHKDILWDILAPINEGDKLFSVDIKNQEPSILINMTESTELYDALKAEEGVYEHMFKIAFNPSTEMTVVSKRVGENRVIDQSEFRKVFSLLDGPLTSDVKPPCNGYFLENKKVIIIESPCYNVVDPVDIEFPASIRVVLEDKSVVRVGVEWDITDKEWKAIKNGKDTKVKGRLQDIELRILPEERKEFKVSWLSICYGAGKPSVSKRCASIDGGRAYDFITNISGIKKYRTMVRQAVRRRPSTIGTVFGTPISIENSSALPSSLLERYLLDYPIQGTGADILNLLVNHFNREIAERGLKGDVFFYMPRHDEVVVEVSKKFYEQEGKDKVICLLNDILGHQVNDWEPFKIEVEMVN